MDGDAPQPVSRSAPVRPPVVSSVYPGSITFIDLIRRNKRRSVVLIGFMIALGMAVGAVIAAVAAGHSDVLLPAAIMGAVAALLVGGLGALWSYFGGASAILAMSGAREIQQSDDPELFNVVDELRLAAGLPMPRVFLLDDSALNAFATGRDPGHAAVAITTGLRSALTRDELQGVMAHEMAHVRHYDIRFAMLMATMVGLIVFACDAFLRIAFHSGRGSRRSDNKGGGAAVAVLIIVAVVLAVIAPLLARIIQMTYSREREYLADAGAVELTRNPEGLISALRKLAGDTDPLVDRANRATAHMFIVNPLKKMHDSGQALDSVMSSHPPIQKRIERLAALLR